MIELTQTTQWLLNLGICGGSSSGALQQSGIEKMYKTSIRLELINHTHMYKKYKYLDSDYQVNQLAIGQVKSTGNTN